MSMDRPPTGTVFIGNIPYDVTEQMLMDMFSQAGPIKSLRLVTDKDTGKPKGYGFCEYHDVQTAQSAVRNLNKHEVNGRMLRVDFADEHQPDARGKRDKEPRGGPGGGAGAGGGREQSLVPPPPPGTRPIGRETSAASAAAMNALLGNAPHTGPSQDKIVTVIAGMTPMQLYEILSQMKTLCAQNAAAARSILVANPQLTKALFQAQVLLGMVKGSAPPPSSLQLPTPPPQAGGQPGPGPQGPMGQQGPQGQLPGQPQGPGLQGPGPQGPMQMMGPPGGPPGQLPPQPMAGPPPPGQFGPMPGGPYGAPPVGQPQLQPPQPQTVTVMGGMPGPMLIDPATGLPYTVPPGAVLVPTGQQPPQQLQPPPQQQQAPPPPMMQMAGLPPPQQQQQAPPPPQQQQQPPQQQPDGPAAPSPSPGPGGAPALPPSLAPQQAAVLQQVLSLTPAQIDALPPAQRQQVLLVRQQLGMGQG